VAVAASIEEALVNHLRADAGVIAVTTAVYPAEAVPSNAPPTRIAYRLTSQEELYDVGGVTGSGTARFGIECWGINYQTAKNLARAVRKSLAGYQGDLSGWWAGDVRVEEARDEGEPPPAAVEQGPPAVTLDVLIFYHEPTA
jgi:Protein of unknown function (DUF3168)